MPTRHRGGSGAPIGWIVSASLLALASTYWYVVVGKARTDAAVIRTWAKSAAVKTAVNTSIKTPALQRRKAVAARKTALLSAYKASAQAVGAKDAAANPVPFDVATLIETKLIKAPAQTIPALLNAAAKIEATAFPLNAKIVGDPNAFNYMGWALLGGTVICGLAGASALIPKRRSFPPANPAAPRQKSPTAVPATAAESPHIAPPAMAPTIAAPTITAPRIAAPAAPPATPFPPVQDTPPMINAPVRGSIAAGVAAVASSSAEVTRLVKRLEELESLSEQLKEERDETRKELSWTQTALDDFKKRVADATTMAAASAAQAAGASEQRAAQAELRVTEAVEHINEALQRAVETEQGVFTAKELARTAEERATHAESRSQEIQFQLARAMERLSDLEQLAASTRGSALTSGAVPLSNMLPSAQTSHGTHEYRPSPLAAYQPSPIDDMLAAAAAKPAAKPVDGPAPFLSPVTPAAEDTDNSPASGVTPSPARSQRTPTPRLPHTKMSEIEAGLKLARSIRTRTQKAASKANGEG